MRPAARTGPREVYESSRLREQERYAKRLTTTVGPRRSSFSARKTQCGVTRGFVVRRQVHAKFNIQ